MLNLKSKIWGYNQSHGTANHIIKCAINCSIETDGCYAYIRNYHPRHNQTEQEWGVNALALGRCGNDFDTGPQ